MYDINEPLYKRAMVMDWNNTQFKWAAVMTGNIFQVSAAQKSIHLYPSSTSPRSSPRAKMLPSWTHRLVNSVALSLCLQSRTCFFHVQIRICSETFILEALKVLYIPYLLNVLYRWFKILDMNIQSIQLLP